MVTLKQISTFENGFFWNNYVSIESDFLKFLEYAPYHESNLKMYSPKLTGLLLQTGGFVDSAFREMASYFDLTAFLRQKDGPLKAVSKGKTVKNIVDYFAVWETIYNLSSNSEGELIAKLDFGDEPLTPFAKFASPSFDKTDWW